ADPQHPAAWPNSSGVFKFSGIKLSKCGERLTANRQSAGVLLSINLNIFTLLRTDSICNSSEKLFNALMIVESI
ncbi:MAG: hypothetical protein AAB966_04990, partial [Patescibacteria group bacterium]